ncbi:MAG TPA: F0F1 ATP synthase subunit A [Clostridiaceae bacterium]|nr:F0F1 ATP synthase subunit A [Clostridiaceae bacterium]
MTIDPSNIVYFEWGFVRITATLVFTWVTMVVLVSISFLVTRNLTADIRISKGQSMLEAIIVAINDQIRQVSQQEPGQYLPFIGTIFLFILTSVLLSIVPGYIAPTGSLNTTIALALCVFFAVPFYGISALGLKGYMKQFVKPTLIMLPFNIISEFSRALSLAVRLYGNIMSSTIIIAILLTVIPLFFPVVMQLLGLLTGVIQAYIFAILAIVYIASATKKPDPEENEDR